MPVLKNEPRDYIKKPLLWAFYYLKNAYSFEDAIKDIIEMQGDTDTNAEIIGGLLGAAYGIDGISNDLIDKVLRMDTDRALFSPKNSIEQLIQVVI
jgi:ADP-ribosylglycohydrolase